MSARTRNALAVALLLLGAVATLAAAVAVYANHVIGDRDGFARKVVEAVHQPAVSREISPRLTGALVDAVPDAVVVQREIDDAATALIASGALDPIVHRAALTLHDAALTDSARNLALDLADGLQLVSSFVAAQRPDLTSRLDPGVTAEVANLRDDGWVPPLGDVARAVNRLASILAVLALALLVGAVAAARDRARALGRVGVAIGAAGVGLFVVDILVMRIVRGQDVASPEAVDQVARVFLGGLVTAAVVLGVAGALIAAVASGRLSSGAGERSASRVWGSLRRSPTTTRGRVARAAALLALGLLLLLEPLPTIEAVLAVAGFFVLVEGLAEVVALLGGTTRDEASPAAPGRRRGVAVGTAAFGILAVVAIAGFGVFRTPAGAVSVSLACNGSERLCDRPLDAVAFPAAHNAMSSANAGFIDPNHRLTIVQQLDHGIRGLLVDSLMAQPTTRRASALTVLDGPVLEQARAEVGPGGIGAVRDFVARRVATPTGPPEPFLCHIVCELGALRMVTTLTEIREWLDRHPREVLVIVIQDLVTPQETERMFRESGLRDRVFTWRTGEPAPTLRRMIDEDRRVLVMAEKDGVPDTWYPPCYPPC